MGVSAHGLCQALEHHHGADDAAALCIAAIAVIAVVALAVARAAESGDRAEIVVGARADPGLRRSRTGSCLAGLAPTLPELTPASRQPYGAAVVDLQSTRRFV